MNSIIVKESSMIRYNYKNSQYDKQLVEPAYWLADRIMYNSDRQEDGVYYTNSSHESNILGVKILDKKKNTGLIGIKVNGQFITYLDPKCVRSLMKHTIYDKTLNGFWLTSLEDITKPKLYEYPLDKDVKRAYYILAGIMTSTISHIYTNDDNSIESIRLTTTKSITSKVIAKIEALFKEIHLLDVSVTMGVDVGCNSKNIYFDEIIIRNEVFTTNITNSVLEKFVQFLRFIYRTGIISFRCMHIPPGIYESPKEVQDIYMQGIGYIYAVTSKFDTKSMCGYVMTSSRSLETSLRHLFEIRGELYRIKYYNHKYYNSKGYRCTINKVLNHTKAIQSILDERPHKDADLLELHQEIINPLEPCIEIFYDSDYIEVDGLVIPS